MAKREINYEAFQQIIKWIKEEPKRLNMGNWVVRLDDNARIHYLPLFGEVVPDEFPTCGTVGCIAGWAVIHRLVKKAKLDLVPENVRNVSIPDPDRSSTYAVKGARILGITKKQSNVLFYTERWPKKYHVNYIKTVSFGDKKGEVKNTINCIKNFLANPDRFVEKSDEYYAERYFKI